MSRRDVGAPIRAPILRTAAAAAMLGLVLHGVAAAQAACGDAGWSWVGVDAFHCPGGTCELRVDEAGGPAFRFSTEPWLRAVDPSGPAADLIEEGDVLVSVNGLLITSPAGGAELARLGEGEATLTVRRDDRLIDVRVTPRHTCEAPLILIGNSVLRLTPGATSPRLIRADTIGARSISPDSLRAIGGGTVIDYSVPERRSRTAIDLSLGLILRCAGCELVVRGGSTRWVVGVYPRVDAVEAGGVADEAGLAPGDEIREIEGRDVRSGRGTELLFSPPRGDFRVRYARGDRETDAFINRRIIDQRVEIIEHERIEGIRIRRSGDEGWGDRLLGSVARWWRRLWNREPRAASGELRVPSGLVTRGDAWGPAGLGVLFRSDTDVLFEVGERDGRIELWLPGRPIVAEVEDGGPAAAGGLRPGDVITRVDGFHVTAPEAAQRLFYLEATRALELRFLRDGREGRATLIPREEP